MIAPNHFLAGAIISSVVREPALALPLSFASHFAMDAIPHHGARAGSGYKSMMMDGSFLVAVSVSLLFTIATIYAVFFADRSLSLQMALGGIIAVSPDFAWPYRYLRFEKKAITPYNGLITRLHKWVQWHESPWAMIIEVLTGLVLFSIFLSI